LAALTSVGGGLNLYENYALMRCCGLYPLLTSGTIGGDIYIGDNENGCNSVDEILNAGPCEYDFVIDIKPRVLNLKSKGKRIISWIMVPEEFDPHDIVGYSLELSIPSCSGCEVIYPTWGFPLRRRYIAFFPRQDLIDEIESMSLGLPTKLYLKLTGVLYDGTPFKGLDTIRVINKRKKWRKRK
jgi:hypothetical protein